MLGDLLYLQTRSECRVRSWSSWRSLVVFSTLSPLGIWSSAETGRDTANYYYLIRNTVDHRRKTTFLTFILQHMYFLGEQLITVDAGRNSYSSHLFLNRFFPHLILLHLFLLLQQSRM